MDIHDWNRLKYGNTLSTPDGAKVVVLHVIRDASGNVEHVGILPALDFAAAQARGFEVASTRASETFLGGRSV